MHCSRKSKGIDQNSFKSKYQHKVKGNGPLTYHFVNPNIDKLKEIYMTLFNNEPPKGLKTPLEKNDHPELDTCDILEGHQVNHYLTMVGQLQWLITLGRFDIQAKLFQCQYLMQHQGKDT